MKSLKGFFARLGNLTTRRAQERAIARRDRRAHRATNCRKSQSGAITSRSAAASHGEIWRRGRNERRISRGARISVDRKFAAGCALRDPKSAPHTRPNHIRSDHPRAGNRNDRSDVQHGRWADFQAVPRPASGKRGHSREHHARQQLRRFLLPRIPGHPRQNEKLRRSNRQRRHASSRLQRRTRSHAAN